MKNRKIALGVIITGVLCALIFVAFDRRASFGEDETSAQIMQKLDDIIAGQKMITERLDAMRDELNVIKIRITQQQ